MNFFVCKFKKTLKCVKALAKIHNLHNLFMNDAHFKFTDLVIISEIIKFKFISRSKGTFFNIREIL